MLQPARGGGRVSLANNREGSSITRTSKFFKCKGLRSAMRRVPVARAGSSRTSSVMAGERWRTRAIARRAGCGSATVRFSHGTGRYVDHHHRGRRATSDSSMRAHENDGLLELVPDPEQLVLQLNACQCVHRTEGLAISSIGASRARARPAPPAGASTPDRSLGNRSPNPAGPACRAAHYRLVLRASLVPRTCATRRRRFSRSHPRTARIPGTRMRALPAAGSTDALAEGEDSCPEVGCVNPADAALQQGSTCRSRSRNRAAQTIFYTLLIQSRSDPVQGGRYRRTSCPRRRSGGRAQAFPSPRWPAQEAAR